MRKELIKSKHGYFSIKNLPLQKELEDYYAKKYYQNESTQYSHSYTDEELKYFENTAKTAHYIFKNAYKRNNKTLLDVGAGEGFFAKYFYNHSWQLTTLDYSDFGIKKHNYDLLPTLQQGDIFVSIDKLIATKKSYSFINLSNVLEHVIDPINLLEKLKKLLLKNGLLRISVPNDYSNFQKFLLKKDYTLDTWFCPPEHLHYFTLESLTSLIISLNYKIEMIMGEFPIELYILNESSNYAKNRDLGKFAHKARIEANNFLFSQGIEKYIKYYESAAEIGLSRQIVIYIKKVSN